MVPMEGSTKKWNFIFRRTFLGVQNWPKYCWPIMTFLSRSNKHGPYFHFATEYLKCRPLKIWSNHHVFVGDGGPPIENFEYLSFKWYIRCQFRLKPGHFGTFCPDWWGTLMSKGSFLPRGAFVPRSWALCQSWVGGHGPSDPTLDQPLKVFVYSHLQLQSKQLTSSWMWYIFFNKI